MKINQYFKPVTNVFSTTNFDSLKTYDSNREVSESQKRKIGKSIEKYGNITVGLVAVINGIYYILDGQHRFSYCKDNNIPFEFKLIELTRIESVTEIMIALNCNGKRWADINYLTCFKNEGKLPYVWLSMLMEQYPKLNISTLKKIFGIKHDEFRSGNWEISQLDFELASDIVKRVSELLPIMYKDGKLNAQPLRSLITIMKHENYIHKKFLSKVKNYNGEFNRDEKILKKDLLKLI